MSPCMSKSPKEVAGGGAHSRLKEGWRLSRQGRFVKLNRTEVSEYSLEVRRHGYRVLSQIIKQCAYAVVVQLLSHV